MAIAGHAHAVTSLRCLPIRHEAERAHRFLLWAVDIARWPSTAPRSQPKHYNLSQIACGFSTSHGHGRKRARFAVCGHTLIGGDKGQFPLTPHASPVRLTFRSGLQPNRAAASTVRVALV
jgi:hypothetical protein